MLPIELDDYLAIAAVLLGVSGDMIVRITNLPLAESALAAPFAEFDGIVFYPHPHEKAGVLCSRLVRNHPLPDGNKRAAYLSMRMFLDINEFDWNGPSDDERASAVEMLADRMLPESEFIRWLMQYISPRVTS